MNCIPSWFLDLSYVCSILPMVLHLFLQSFIHTFYPISCSCIHEWGRCHYKIKTEMEQWETYLEFSSCIILYSENLLYFTVSLYRVNVYFCIYILINILSQLSATWRQGCPTWKHFPICYNVNMDLLNLENIYSAFIYCTLPAVIMTSL